MACEVSLSVIIGGAVSLQGTKEESYSLYWGMEIFWSGKKFFFLTLHVTKPNSSDDYIYGNFL